MLQEKQEQRRKNWLWDIVNDIEQEVETQHAEDGLVNRVLDLKQLSENIEKRQCRWHYM